MKKKIHINLKLIVIILALLVGIGFLISGAKKLSKCEDAVSFDALEEKDLKDGAYVSGYISKFVVRTEMVNDEPVRSAVSQTIIEFTGESDIYTIPIKPDTYIQLMVWDGATKDKFESMIDTSGERVYFEGIVHKRTIEPNNAWYGAVDKNEYPGINDVISEYYIQEIDKDSMWNSVRIGAILCLVALVIFIDCGGFGGLVEEEEIKQDIQKVKNLEYLNNKDDELLARESLLRILTRKQKRIKSKKTSSIVMLTLGVLSLIVVPKIIFISLVLILFGGKGFLAWFMNSSNLYAIKISKKIGYDSLYIMIEQCKRDIRELEELVYNEERDQENGFGRMK